MKKIISSLEKSILLACLLCISLDAKIENWSEETSIHQQYKKSEWSIIVTTNWSTTPHLYTEVAVDMKMLTPAGKELTLPCYYVSGESGSNSVWEARFTPQEAGEYQYCFELTEKESTKNRTEADTFKVAASGGKGFLHAHNNWSFQFDNGELFRGIGYNIGWENRENDDSKHFKKLHEDPKFNYFDMLQSLANNGGNFFRTWMVYWNLPVDWPTIRNSNRYVNSDSFFNESGAERLDTLIDICERLDLYMMISIDTHVSLLDFGWSVSKYARENGGFASSPIDFFTDEATKTLYKAKLRYLIARWGYSPHIAVWEFFNEVDNAMYPKNKEWMIPQKDVTAWHSEMAQYIKTTDPYQHLVSTSISHRDINGLNDLPAIDFNQKHIYRNTSQIPATLREYVDRHKKPYVIGEFSYEWDWSKNFDDFAEEMDNDFKRGLWYGLFSPTPILPMSWWWEYFQNRNTTRYMESVRIMNRRILESGKGSLEFIPLKTIGEKVTGLALKAGETFYIYLNNPTKEPSKFSFLLDLEEMDTSSLKCVKYTCETRDFETIEIKADRDAASLFHYALEPRENVILIIEKL